MAVTNRWRPRNVAFFVTKFIKYFPSSLLNEDQIIKKVRLV